MVRVESVFDVGGLAGGDGVGFVGDVAEVNLFVVQSYTYCPFFILPVDASCAGFITL